MSLSVKIQHIMNDINLTTIMCAFNASKIQKGGGCSMEYTFAKQVLLKVQSQYWANEGLPPHSDYILTLSTSLQKHFPYFHEA